MRLEERSQIVMNSTNNWYRIWDLEKLKLTRRWQLGSVTALALFIYVRANVVENISSYY